MILASIKRYDRGLLENNDLKIYYEIPIGKFD